MIKHRVKMNPSRADFFRDLHALPFEQVEVKYNHRSVLKRMFSMVKPLAYKLGVFQLYLKFKQFR